MNIRTRPISMSSFVCTMYCNNLFIQLSYPCCQNSNYFQLSTRTTKMWKKDIDRFPLLFQGRNHGEGDKKNIDVVTDKRSAKQVVDGQHFFKLFISKIKGIEERISRIIEAMETLDFTFFIFGILAQKVRFVQLGFVKTSLFDRKQGWSMFESEPNFVAFVIDHPSSL